MQLCCKLQRNPIGTQLKAIVDGAQGDADGYLPGGAGLGEHALHLLVAVAIEGHARAQALGHLIGIDAIAGHAVGAQTFELTVVVEETESVAIGKAGRTGHIEGVAADLLDRADELAYSLGGIERGDAGLAPMGEIGGVATVERLPQVGFEGIGATPQRGPAVLVGMLTDDGVEALTIGGRDVLHVRDILQATFDLKRGGTSLGQSQQVVALVHVLQREQITLVLNLTAVGILQGEAHPTELGALTTVGAPAETVLGGIADAGIADAQGAMDENL